MVHEPRPQAVNLPEQQVPLLRVGLVLPEDGRQHLSLRPTEGLSYTISLSGTERANLISGAELSVERKGTSLLVRLDAGNFEISDGEALSVRRTKAAELSAHAGLIINPITVGRSFHWKKDVALTFPGDFEISASAEGLQVVNQVDFEDYCTCVITSEMSPGCPASFAFAQATAARSWSYVFLRNKHPNSGFDVCNDDDCQRYQGTTFLSAASVDAVRLSRGMYLRNPEGNACAAYYSKSCGGYVEEPLSAFGFSVPGLTTQADREEPIEVDLTNETAAQKWILTPARHCCCSPDSISEKILPRYLGAVDKPDAYFRWTYQIARDQLSALVRERLELPELSQVLRLKHGKRGRSGRLMSIAVDYLTSAGDQRSVEIQGQYSIRRALHSSFLYSSAFIHEWITSTTGAQDQLKLTGAGWGHGVGLCQIGALALALKGMSGEAILKHYFPSCEVVRAYE